MITMSLIDLILRNLSIDDTRSLISNCLYELLGENTVVGAIKKVCMINDINVLRIMLILLYKTDPLYNRMFVPEKCYCRDGDVLEIYLEGRDGDHTICIGLTKSEPFMPTACSTVKTDLPERSIELSYDQQES